jgi:hypothetical protein
MSVNQHTESNTSNYLLLLDSEKYGTVQRYCQSVILPSITIAAVPQKIGYTTINVPGDKIQFDPIRLEILLDRDINSYLEMMSLMFEEVDQDSGELAPSKVKFDAKVIILDNIRNHLFEFKFHDAFFTSLDGLTFDHRETDNITYGAELAFTKYSYRSLTRTSK